MTKQQPSIEINITSIDELGKASGAVFSGGTWWKSLRKGFWWPVDFSSSIDPGQRPAHFSYWGYQHVCPPEAANSIVRYMYISDLEGFDINALKSAVRRNVRQSLKNLEFRAISAYDDNERESAAACWNELVSRTGWRGRMTGDEFKAYWKSLLTLPGYTLIGAFHEAQLAGWLIGITLDNGNSYIPRYAASSDFFNLRVNNGLIYSFLDSASRAGARNCNFGLFIPDNPDLDRFKENMGFELTSMPAFTYINPLLKPLLAKLYRSEIDRLTGWFSSEKTAVAASAGES